MLELRPNCECCNKDLNPDVPGAMICSFECTFCTECSKTKLGGKCPNCGGTLVMRPLRDKAKLKNYPASTVRVYKQEAC